MTVSGGDVIVRTPAGTIRCVLCTQEWISDDVAEHADPQCLMWVLRADAFPNDDSPAVSPSGDV